MNRDSIDSRVDKAVEMLKDGYNCSQSLLATYSDLLGLEKETALKISAPFGRGLAATENVCGAINTMSIAAGLHNGSIIPGDDEGKAANFGLVKKLISEFEQEQGSTICRVLLGLESGLPDGKQVKPCAEYVRHSAQLLEKYLFDQERA